MIDSAGRLLKTHQGGACVCLSQAACRKGFACQRLHLKCGRSGCSVHPRCTHCAAQAFDVLERLDPDQEYVEGKKGAAVGTFQLVVAGKEPKDSLRDIVAMLRNGSGAADQFNMIANVIVNWAKKNGIKDFK